MLNIYLHLNFRASSLKSQSTRLLALYDLGLNSINGINFRLLLRRDCSANVKQCFDKFKTCISVFFEFFSCKLRAEIDCTLKKKLLAASYEQGYIVHVLVKGSFWISVLLKRPPILIVTWIKRNWKNKVNTNANLYVAQAMARLQWLKSKMIGWANTQFQSC